MYWLLCIVLWFYCKAWCIIRDMRNSHYDMCRSHVLLFLGTACLSRCCYVCALSIELFPRESRLLRSERRRSSLTVGVRSGIRWLCLYQDPHRVRRTTVSRIFMTTCSGRVYAMSESGDTAVTELVKILLKDRKRREEEATEERR